VDVNRASAAELETLPGIGPALARRIMESRAEDGPFRTADDLLRVRGIGPATLERIRGLVRAGG
jgi:competence protein ComEA